MLRIKNATDALTDVVALTDVGRKTTKSKGSKEPLEVARETLGETMKTSGDAGETIVTPGDAKEPPTTATRSRHEWQLTWALFFFEYKEYFYGT